MQYVNDDMDELFRRAAENYPLDTRSADWNKVLAALQGESEIQKVSEKKNNNKGRLLWLLLLLPFGLICNQLYNPDVLNSDEISQSDKNSIPEKTIVTQSNSVTQMNIGTNDKTGTENKINTKNGIASDPENTIDKKNFVDQTFRGKHNLKLLNAISGKKKNSRGYSSLKNDFLFDQPATQELNRVGETNNDFLFHRNYISEIAYRNGDLTAPEIIATRSLTPLFINRAEVSKSTIRVQKPKKFYAGIMGGLDATTIKFQKIQDAGLNYGIVLGYQINKKWSIEAGAFMERKYYYSNGKYFNTSKIYMPANAWIEDLSGNCKMIEVPVSARYNFIGRKQSSWFTTVGFSSYFLSEENYTYNYYYGTVGPVPHTKQYNNSSTHLFSNISISGGYTHKLGNFADLRIEPYLKLPVSKMGVGSLPFFSTGLQLGITKKF